MLKSLKGNNQFLEELSIYQTSEQNAVLKKHKYLLQREISAEDSIALVDLSGIFNSILDVAIVMSSVSINDF